MNCVIVMGRLCNEPERKVTGTGLSVCTVRIAVDSGYVDQSGNRRTDFFSVVCWRGTAEFVCKYFVKGSPIAVMGKLQSRSWEDKHGQKRVDVEIVADNVYFAGHAPGEKSGQPSAVSAPVPSAVSAPPVAVSAEQARFDFRNDFRPLEEDDENVPF